MEQTALRTILPEFIKSLTDKGRSPSTIIAYRADLEQFVDFAESKQKPFVQFIGSEFITSYRDALLANKYTPKSVSRKLNAIKTFFKYIKSQNYISTNPAQDVAHPKIEGKKPKYLSKIEYRALRDTVRDDIRTTAIVELILQTGLRISEVANLKLKNIEDDKIIIEAYASQPQRTVPLNRRGKEALLNYIKKARPKVNSDFVFVSKNGKQLAIRNIRMVISKYMQKAELPNYSVNDLRTTFIVENLKAGVSLTYLSQVAGHKRISTTESYLEIAEVQEAGNKQELTEL